MILFFRYVNRCIAIYCISLSTVLTAWGRIKQCGYGVKCVYEGENVSVEEHSSPSHGRGKVVAIVNRHECWSSTAALCSPTPCTASSRTLQPPLGNSHTHVCFADTRELMSPGAPSRPRTPERKGVTASQRCCFSVSKRQFKRRSVHLECSWICIWWLFAINLWENMEQ